MDVPPSAPMMPPPRTHDDGGEGLVRLPTAARTRWRIQGALVGLVLGVTVGGALTMLASLVVGTPAVAVGVVVAVVGVTLGVVWANRRHQRFGYLLDRDRLRVIDGVVVHSDAVAPLFRVQHVDLTRGPLQLAFGLATLSVHTAAPAADVTLPDLRGDDAERIRDEILTASRAAAAALGVDDADAV